jgi:hypothetical protein
MQCFYWEVVVEFESTVTPPQESNRLTSNIEAAE